MLYKGSISCFICTDTASQSVKLIYGFMAVQDLNLDGWWTSVLLLKIV